MSRKRTSSVSAEPRTPSPQPPPSQPPSIKRQRLLIHKAAHSKSLKEFKKMVNITVDERYASLQTIAIQACMRVDTERMQYLFDRFGVLPTMDSAQIVLASNGITWIWPQAHSFVLFVVNVMFPHYGIVFPAKLMLRTLCVFVSFDWNSAFSEKTILFFKKHVDFATNQLSICNHLKTPEMCALLVDNGVDIGIIKRQFFLDFVHLRQKHLAKYQTKISRQWRLYKRLKGTSKSL